MIHPNFCSCAADLKKNLVPHSQPKPTEEQRPVTVRSECLLLETAGSEVYLTIFYN